MALDELVRTRLNWWQTLGLAYSGLLVAFAVDISLDSFLHYDFIKSSLYLIPVTLAAWTSNWKLALIIAVTGASLEAASSAYSLMSGHRHGHEQNSITQVIFVLELVTLSCAVPVVAKLREMFDRVNELASRDPLTGVFNSRVFDMEVALEIERMRRGGVLKPLTLVFLDIDNFKSINDQFGHSVGDKVLNHVAQTLSLNVRKVDVVGRLGGDEFGVMMPSTAEVEAKAALDRFVTTLSKTSPVPVTMSVGLASFHEAPTTVDAILAASDEAMYQAKHSGKNKVVVTTVKGGEHEVTGEFPLRAR